MVRVCITGITGFVGANLAHALIERGDEVIGLVRPGYQPWRIVDILSHIQLIPIDLTDAAAVKQLFQQQQFDWVFHLAVYGAYSSQTDMHRMISTNITSTVNLVDAALAADVDCFINTGSSSEYGVKSTPPSEQAWLEPNSNYAITKAAATHYCRHMARIHQAKIITLRLYSVYGPWEEPTRLLPQVILAGLKGSLPVLASPDIARDFIYTTDVVSAYLHVATSSQHEIGAVYNVGTGQQTQLRHVVEVARQILPITQEPRWNTMAQRSWDSSTWVANPAALQSIRWQTQMSFAQGLAAFVAWMTAVPERIAQYEALVRQTQRLL